VNRTHVASRRAGLWTAAALLIAVGFAAAPAPDADAAGGRSRFDFVPGDFSVAIVGSGRDAASYYLPYSLSNPMDEARTPRLHIELTTETGGTHGDHSDPRVLSAAEKALKTTGLKSTAGLRAEPLAAGASVQAIANFGNIDPNADEMTVRVFGLWDPVLRTKQGKVYKESRVLVLKYARKGDEYDRPLDPIHFVSKKEEVQGEVVELYSTTATAPKK
jgi:hypothetical protein